MNEFVFYPDGPEILETWISISSFKYFRVVRIEKQIPSFVFGEKLRLDNFVSRSTDLYHKEDFNPFRFNQFESSMVFLEIHCVRLPKKRPVLPSFAHSFVAWLELEFVGEPGTKQLAEHVQAIAIKIFEKTLLFEFLAPLTSP